MENVCRICRKICTNSSVPIISEHNGVPLKEILDKTCPIEITSDDPISQLFPQAICTDCLDIASSAYNLQQTCIESDLYFRSKLSGDEIFIKEEELEQESVLVKDEDVVVKIEAVDAPVPRKRRRAVKTIKCSDIEAESDEEWLPEVKKPKPIEKVFLVRKAAAPVTSKNFRKCNFCGEEMARKRNMAAHLQNHYPGLFPFPCEYCIQRFKSQDEHTDHMKKSHSSGSNIEIIVFCDICGVSGNSKEGMERHIIEDHLDIWTKRKSKKNKKYLQCSHCSAKYYKKKFFDWHLLTMHGAPVECQMCGEKMSSKHDKRLHILMVHEKLLRKLKQPEICKKCCICQLDHATEDELMKHLDTHRNSFIPDIECYLCAKTLKTFDEFISHNKKHADPKTHECSTCKKRSAINSSFLDHCRKRHTKQHKKVECSNCSFKFASTKELEIHNKIKHLQETMFICPICAKSLSSKISFESHMKLVHASEEDKKFHCKSCPMKFVQLKRLKNHEATHSSARPHVCEFCGKAFKLPHGLAVHKRGMHNPNLQKNHQCNQCPLKFSDQHKLKYHMITHTGLKPHECKYCDKAYTSRGDLIKHLKRVHVGDAVYHCDKCSKTFEFITELREHQSEHANFQLYSS